MKTNRENMKEYKNKDAITFENVRNTVKRKIVKTFQTLTKCSQKMYLKYCFMENEGLS
ncbi:hypothetical protein [Peribacillus asahii]|uniref:hypothetical protein n=1 Tax=Peribacillus asahii TaxID=228899 RepID=UPI00207AB4E7|nr:hypothetical protein [Peribacillus asahii]USK58557.1 hypothetical protein LIT37_15100 [Peribacillus asahii]